MRGNRRFLVFTELFICVRCASLLSQSLDENWYDQESFKLFRMKKRNVFTKVTENNKWKSAKAKHRKFIKLSWIERRVAFVCHDNDEENRKPVILVCSRQNSMQAQFLFWQLNHHDCTRYALIQMKWHAVAVTATATHATIQIKWSVK